MFILLQTNLLYTQCFSMYSHDTLYLSTRLRVLGSLLLTFDTVVPCKRTNLISQTFSFAQRRLLACCNDETGNSARRHSCCCPSLGKLLLLLSTQNLVHLQPIQLISSLFSKLSTVPCCESSNTILTFKHYSFP